MNIGLAKLSDYEYILQNDRHLLKELIDGKIKQKEIIIAKDNNNRNLGWIRYNYFWDNTPFMNMLFVEECHRGKGIGKELVKYWEEMMKLRGHEIVLTSTLSNEQAQHFYRKLGYIDSGSLLLENEPLEIIFTKHI